MQKKQRRPVRRNCIWCQSARKPDYKNAEELRRYLTDRGRIISRGRTGVCAKHQRQLAREIKRARHLALLPFAARIK